jgi:hypothetical protein
LGGFFTFLDIDKPADGIIDSLLVDCWAKAARECFRRANSSGGYAEIWTDLGSVANFSLG